jgi:hypothetical protein
MARVFHAQNGFLFSRVVERRLSAPFGRGARDPPAIPKRTGIFCRMLENGRLMLDGAECLMAEPFAVSFLTGQRDGKIIEEELEGVW